MPFWTRPLDIYKCPCGAKATTEVVSPINEVNGRFCKRCAERKVRELNADPSIERNLRDYVRWK